jgi:hypothetical protein
VLAGGFAGLIEDGRGFEIAPIEFEITDDLAHWRVDGKAGAAPRRSRAQPLPREARGSTTRRVRRSPRDVGTANEDEVEAFGLQWSPPARSSKHLPFDCRDRTSPDLKAREGSASSDRIASSGHERRLTIGKPESESRDLSAVSDGSGTLQPGLRTRWQVSAPGNGSGPRFASWSQANVNEPDSDARARPGLGHRSRSDAVGTSWAWQVPDGAADANPTARAGVNTAYVPIALRGGISPQIPGPPLPACIGRQPPRPMVRRATDSRVGAS